MNEALADCQAAVEKHDYYHRQVEVLKDAYRGTHELMDNGKASYLEVLTAQETLLNAQLNEATNMYNGALGIIDGQQNKDILKYCGIFQAGSQFISADRRWVADVTFVKRQGWNLNFNTIVNVGFRFSKRDNQYLMLHFYDGYGENLLDYNKYHCRLRVGLLIRPNFFSDF